jgi:hypothetical protein
MGGRGMPQAQAVTGDIGSVEFVNPLFPLWEGPSFPSFPPLLLATAQVLAFTWICRHLLGAGEILAISFG